MEKIQKLSKDQKNKKIVLTGGHAATTAIAVIEELLRRKESGVFNEIYWIGAKYALEGRKIRTLESTTIPKLGVRSFNIISGRIQKRFSVWTIPSLFKIPIGFFHALYILAKIKPNLILSFGGYSAFPVVVVGKMMNIPIVIHEQTMVYGLANKISSSLATKVTLARKESLEFFPKEKSVVVGNPLMTQMFDVGVKRELSSPPYLLITCGSRGSQQINSLIKKVLDTLLKEFVIIHQTGEPDFNVFRNLKASLPKKLQERYEIFPQVEPMQMDNLYRQADIVVARAGANTVSEIIAIKRPSVLIPIPWSYKDEQNKNAQMAKSYKIAEIFEQDNASPRKFLQLITKVKDNYSSMVTASLAMPSPDKQASNKLVTLLENLIA
jgi:UDP-N-acetylglucosamine--N-acetylmuramyl-(pentapeptide) pyrophosphoryl-undecaprenol N-acetylglucosamine transferase